MTANEQPGELLTLVWFALAFMGATLVALGSFGAFALSRGQRLAVVAVLAVPIALSPWCIPPNASLLRLLAAMHATALLVKLVDLHAATWRSRLPSLPEFGVFLLNWFSVVWRRLGAEPRPSLQQNLQRLGHALWRTALVVCVLAWLFRTDWQRVPFAVEHCAKSLALFCALIPGSAIGVSLWRLAGGRARDFMTTPLLAPTPAEFWRRYNRPAQQFLHEDVFKPAGGLRGPVRATLVTFAVSAVVHEYVFGIVLGRVQGYQTAFFLLQGLAVAATLRLRPTGWGFWAGLAATWIFNLATSVFFFASLNGVVRFYSRPLPNWLAGW